MSEEINVGFYPLEEPIEWGKGDSLKVIDHLNFTKPNMEKLLKVKATDPYNRGFEMIVACVDQPAIVLKRLSYADVHKIMEEFLPDFLNMNDASTEE